MAIRNVCRLIGQALGIIALILFVVPAMALFTLYDFGRWAVARMNRRATEPAPGAVDRTAWCASAKFG